MSEKPEAPETIARKKVESLHTSLKERANAAWMGALILTEIGGHGRAATALRVASGVYNEVARSVSNDVLEDMPF